MDRETHMEVFTDRDMHGVVIGASAGSPMAAPAEEDQMGLRRGPWTTEEDIKLVNYIHNHGEGRWNSLARCAGLRRTGKSCRLRWLNYLRPDVRRGNISPEEQLLILELHSRWGNRWSKIAQHLPGRTDNEIKNYWRTRVQKHAKQLKCDVNSKQFKDVMRYLWMPRLVERIRGASAAAMAVQPSVISADDSCIVVQPERPAEPIQLDAVGFTNCNFSAENSSAVGSSEISLGTHVSSPPVSDLTDCFVARGGDNGVYGGGNEFSMEKMMGDGAAAAVAGSCSESLLSPCGYFNQGFPDFELAGWGVDDGDFSSDNLWGSDDLWFL